MKERHYIKRRSRTGGNFTHVSMCIGCFPWLGICKIFAMATLFSYFTKSPKTATTPGNKTNTSPKEQAKGTQNGNVVTPVRPRSVEIGVVNCDVGEVVWAKMDGHPWWPSMICKHPSSKRHQRKYGQTIMIHVQFFGKPLSRGWVRKR